MKKPGSSISSWFQLRTPLIVAPMGGGPTTPELVAAASNAGAIGSLAGAYLSPDQLRKEIQKTRSLTPDKFIVNLFLPASSLHLDPLRIKTALEYTRPYRKELQIPDPELSPPYQQDFEKQFTVLLEEAPAAFSFIFGSLDPQRIHACRQKNIFTIGTATTLAEGFALEASGVNAVIAQGYEAGGHRALFSADDEDLRLGTFELTSALTQNLQLPVISAGGLMTRQDITHALSRGAEAVQLGTAFLLSKEAGTSEVYRQALRERKNSPTCLTRAFSGRWARGFENRLIRELKDQPSAILPFPAQNALTRDIRLHATRQHNAEFLSLCVGKTQHAGKFPRKKRQLLLTRKI